MAGAKSDKAEESISRDRLAELLNGGPCARISGDYRLCRLFPGAERPGIHEHADQLETHAHEELKHGADPLPADRLSRQNADGYGRSQSRRRRRRGRCCGSTSTTRTRRSAITANASANARLSRIRHGRTNPPDSGGRAGSPDRSGHGAWGRRARSHRAAKVARHRRRTGNGLPLLRSNSSGGARHRRARRHRQAPVAAMSHLGVSCLTPH